MRSRWRLSALFAVGTMLMGVSAGAAIAQTTSPGEQSKEPVVFTWGTTGEPSSLNPMRGYLALDFYFWTPSYHLLIDFAQKDFSADPSLATNVETSPDSMSFTYTIRDDITWSDGQPLTAEDVAFTLNLYKSSHAYLPQNYLTLIDGDVVATDPTHITFRTKEPTGLYSGEVPYMYDYILPKHVWEEFDKPKQYDNVPQVGSGPFVIEEYQTGEFVRMVRNPEWNGPEPHIDEIVTRFFKNFDALAEALKAGEIDFIYDLTAPNIFNSLKEEPNIGTAVGTVPSFDEIGMNTGSAYYPKTDTYTPHGDGHQALTDPDVRRAIRMAIDSETLSEKVWLGYAKPGTAIIPPVSAAGARWEPTGDEVISWDIPGANQLLDDAGYLDTDDDGVREMPGGGEPLEFRYFVRTSDQTTIDAAPFIRSWLKQIGIAADVQAVTSGRLGDIINAGEYELFHWGWFPDIDPDSALSWFTCDQRPPDGHTYGNNDSYYCDSEYDELYAQQRAELDLDKRWEIVHQMQAKYYEDAAYVVLWYSPLLEAYRTDAFTGYQPQPLPQGDLLQGYGGPSKVWWTLRPVGEGTGGGAETRGIPGWVWIGVVVGVLVVIAAIVLARRARPEEEQA